MSKEQEYVKPATTFIDKGITLRAKKLRGTESVRIDGTYVGDIDLDGYLQVGETGFVEGDLQVSYALIAGEVTGDILCRTTLHLASTAKIHGNISAGRVIIDEGTVFYGNCKTRDDAKDLAVT